MLLVTLPHQMVLPPVYTSLQIFQGGAEAGMLRQYSCRQEMSPIIFLQRQVHVAFL